jgi:hypothetical protein
MAKAKPGQGPKKRGTGKRSSRKAPSVPPIAECRGVASFDTNEILLLVRAPVEQVAAAFRDLRGLATWAPNAQVQTVTVSDPCYLVYRLEGHPWTIIDLYHGSGGYPEARDAEALSAALGTTAIYYGNSDTAGATGYELFENGQRLERFEFYEEIEFESKLRRVEHPEDMDDVYAFVDAFLRAQDALAPGWSAYLGGWCHRPGQEVRLNLDLGEDGGRRVVERLDFLGA